MSSTARWVRDRRPDFVAAWREACSRLQVDPLLVELVVDDHLRTPAMRSGREFFAACAVPTSMLDAVLSEISLLSGDDAAEPRWRFTPLTESAIRHREGIRLNVLFARSYFTGVFERRTAKPHGGAGVAAEPPR